MNKKLIIQIVIVVVAFGASGLVLYNAFFKGPEGVPITMTTTGTQTVTPDNLLPYGSNPLDFSILHSRPFQYNQITFPTLNPQTEVGVAPDVLIESTSGQ